MLVKFVLPGMPEKTTSGAEMSAEATPTPPTGTKGIDEKGGEVRGTVPETENTPREHDHGLAADVFETKNW